MKLISCLLIMILNILFTPPAHAQAEVFRPVQTSIDDLELMDVGTVAEIVKSDLIRLDNGKRYLLSNVRIPPFYALAASDCLAKLLVGKKVGVYRNGKVKEDIDDGNGNIYAHIQTADGLWVQQDLIAQGLAWVDSTQHRRDLILPLYKEEARARKKKTGLWANPEFTVRNVLNIHADKRSFQLFEGTVRRVDFGNDVAFRFGKEGEPQFTAFIDTLYLPLFRLTPKEQTNFRSFKDIRVRLRGWIEENKNGQPSLALTHPEQIEFPDFENDDRESLWKLASPPPIMPYDVKVGAVKK